MDTTSTDGNPKGSRVGGGAADKAPMEGISCAANGKVISDQVKGAGADKRPPAAAHHDDEEPPDNIDVFPPQSQESAAMSTLTPSQDYLDEYESEGLTEAELRGLGVEKDNGGAPSGAAAGAAAASASAAAVGGDASIGDLPCTQDTIPTVNLDHRDAGGDNDDDDDDDDDDDGDNDDGQDEEEAPVESSQQSSLLLDTQPPGGSTATGSSIDARSGRASGIAVKRSAAGDAICSEDCREDHSGGSENTKNKRQKTSSEEGNGEVSPTASIVAEISRVSETAPASAPAPASNRMSFGRTKRLDGSRRRNKYADRPRRRRRWTDDEGVPSFLAILTSDTPPPSDDEEEMADTAQREREWAEHGRFVVDIDALLGLASPESGVIVKEEKRGDGGGDGAASAKVTADRMAGNPIETDLNDGKEEDDDPLAEYLPPSGGETKEKTKTSHRSSLYRIGSDVRARVWNAAIEGGSVLPDESSSSDVILLGDNRAADPFVAPGVVRPDISGLARRSDGDGDAITASGLPIDIKSSEVIRSTGVSSAMPTTTPKTFFEGIIPLALPDDEDYLPELHCIVRQNLELFSATDEDCADKSYGKRTPIVRGKVGIRCVHCAAASIAAVSTDATAPDFVGSNSKAPFSSPQRKLKYVGGSVSYISSISSLSNIACQKPQLHFALCPHTPSNVKEHLHRLTHDEDGNPLRQRAGAVVRKLGISSTKYWLVAARRVGLVDVRSGGGGIRFGRDPQLPPRAVREVISEDPALTRPVYSAASAAAVSFAGASPAGLNSVAASSAAFPTSVGIMTKTMKIKADEKSDAVLQGMLAEIKAYEEEKQNPADGQAEGIGKPLPFLVTSHDLDISSDYSFLLASLVTVVHATQYDAMNPRGKRSRSFRPGTAGFTCRNCADMMRQREASGNVGGYESGTAASSFPSTEMALCTTVTQSLLNHWQKCVSTKQEVKDAILAYKKIHPMQVSQLPKGTNGRFWAMLFHRLRELDKESSEMVDGSGRDNSILPAGSLTNAAATRAPTEVQSQVNATGQLPFTTAPRSPSPSPNERPDNFPTSNNQETLEVLDAAKNEAFDGILFASLSEMMLVTDFVFLILKNMSPCQLLASDLKYRRNVGKGGVQCRHCLKRGSIRYGGAASGRTFPSAPDNWASSLKESCFNHLMRCDLVPENIQRALGDLKPLHTEQMNTLKFGAQRQYLRILHQRISAWAAANREGATANASVNNIEVESNIRLPQLGADDTSLEKHGFCNSIGWYGCVRCRMVPFDLRARGSLSQQRPNESFVAEHAKICKGGAFDLGALLTVAKQMVDAVPNPNISLEIIQSPAFKEFVRSLVGDSDNLVDVLTEGVVALSKATADATSGDEKFNSRGLWTSFPASIDMSTTKLLFDNLLREIDSDSAEKLRANEHFKSYIRIVAPSMVDFHWMDGENQDETASPKQAT